MGHPPGKDATVASRPPHDQWGLTIVEILIGLAVTLVVVSAISIVIGAAVQSKVIASTRSADTETARASLAWMSERLRNAGFNLKPSAQSQLRCKDRVVAQDTSLLPTSSSVYVSGEILNANTTAGDEVSTIGYYLATDSGSGNQVIMEYNQLCSSGSTAVSTYSNRLSNPKVSVISLTFQYFDVSGAQVTNLTSATQIRLIRIISISVTVKGSEGTSGAQAQTLTRFVRFWDPEPYANNWVDLNENF